MMFALFFSFFLLFNTYRLCTLATPYFMRMLGLLGNQLEWGTDSDSFLSRLSYSGRYTVLYTCQKSSKWHQQKWQSGNSKSLSLHKAKDKLAKTIRIKLFRNLESNQKFAATRKTFNYGRKKSWILVRQLCGILTYPGHIPHPIVCR